MPSWEPTSLLEAMEESVSVYTRDGVFVYANPATARMFGKPIEEMLGRTMWDLWPEAVGSGFFHAFRRVEATGIAEQTEEYFPPWDRWFRDQIFVVGDHVHVVATDITEQKRGETRLLVLSRASHAFAHAVELEPLFETIARTLAELVGDSCLVRIVENGRLRPVAIHHTDPELEKVIHQFFARPLGETEGVSVKVLDTGEPLLIERLDLEALRETFSHEEHKSRIQPGGIHSVMASVLRNGDERVGVVTLLRDRTARPYTQSDLSLLQDLTDRASMAVARASLFEQAQRERRRALAVAAASRAFSAAERDTHAILELLTQAAVAELGELAIATVLTQDGQHLEPVAFHSSSEITSELRSALRKREPLAGTLSEKVIASRETLRVALLDVEALARETHEHFSDLVRRFAPKCCVMVPIQRNERVLGTLFLSRHDSTVPYSDDDQRLLEDLCDRAAIALTNSHALEAERVARQEAERVAHQTRRLNAIGTQLSNRRSAVEVADTILKECSALLGDAPGGIWLVDEAGSRLDMLALIHYRDLDRFASFPLDPDIPLAAAVLTKAPVVLESFADYMERFPTSASRVVDAVGTNFATACFPLISEARAIGVFAFVFPNAHEFRDDERTFLEVIANQCAQAIDRSRLLDQERAATAALAETNRTLHAMVHASPAAIVMTDLHGMIRIWNPAAENLFGWSAAEMLGQRWPTLDTEQRHEVLENFAELARGQEIRGREMRRPRRDGTMIDVAMWAAPVMRPDGDTHGLALFVDITDRRLAEEVARTADRRKDEFLAMLGHELRNPLAPILTVLELMRMRGESAVVQERALIERQTRHLVRLVDDLLDISRITRGKVELRKHRVDLGVAIAQAVEMASPLLEQRNHHVSIAAPRGLAFIDGDEFRIAQIFQNLLTNAAKYTPSGGSVTVRLSIRDKQAVADVEDDGEGIAADVLPTIFDPFVQGAQKLDRSAGGLGIGLTLVRSLVEMHGGQVEAHSAGRGHGSRFTVRLPLALATVPVAQGTPQGMVQMRHAKRRILLVDDNRDGAEMLAELLRAAGHEVVVAFDGPSALGTLPTFKPDVALLDIGLPVMDGYDLARKLRRALPEPPRLVAITGYGQEHDRRRSLEAGFDAHLVKPVQAAQVLAAIDEPAV